MNAIEALSRMLSTVNGEAANRLRRTGRRAR